MYKYKSTRRGARDNHTPKREFLLWKGCYVMKHQQIQLACKRNVIRLVALVAMLAVMACGMILSISAANVAESVTFATDSGIEFDSQTNRWVKTYDGQTVLKAQIP